MGTKVGYCSAAATPDDDDDDDAVVVVDDDVYDMSDGCVLVCVRLCLLSGVDTGPGWHLLKRQAANNRWVKEKRRAKACSKEEKDNIHHTHTHTHTHTHQRSDTEADKNIKSTEERDREIRGEAYQDYSYEAEAAVEIFSRDDLALHMKKRNALQKAKKELLPKRTNSVSVA